MNYLNKGIIRDYNDFSFFLKIKAAIFPILCAVTLDSSSFSVQYRRETESLKNAKLKKTGVGNAKGSTRDKT